MFTPLLVLLGISTALLSTAFPVEKRASRTSPPSGAVIVKNPAASGQFSTIQAAINSLPNDSSSRTIFIFPGTYSEQVSITRTGPTTILGSTTDTTSYTSNSVTITHSLSAAAAGNDDSSGTLRVHKDNFSMYNVNVRNTFGVGSQALALSSYGNNIGYYGCAFYGYQDTVLANEGTLSCNQYFGVDYIEGAVDYIFGQHARVFFQRNVIASVAAGAITADGPTSASDTSLFVINRSTVQTSTAAKTDLTGKVFLGRPWTQWARVAFTNTNLGALINGAGWEIWSTATPNTAAVTFAEFRNTGTGASGTRASFSKKLSSTAGYNAADVLGSNWTSWVDQAYV
ncbi:pectinesterase [Favolaschia claudopus]|uniref:Pectinesterase n=1 Tax=Favolaschia claudopus TaxID=2862362 RepID=A0AAV9ZLD6_9AGAR